MPQIGLNVFVFILFGVCFYLQSVAPAPPENLPVNRQVRLMSACTLCAAYRCSMWDFTMRQFTLRVGIGSGQYGHRTVPLIGIV